MTPEEIRTIALKVANDLTLTQAITGDEIYKLCTRFLAAIPVDDTALQEQLAQERERCAKELERLNYQNFSHAAICIRSMR